MKIPSLPTLVACLAAASSGAHAATYLIDFNTNDTSGYPGGASAWNSYAAPANVTGALTDTSGTVSSITIAQIGLNDSSATGAAAFNNPNGGPAWVTTDGSLGNTSAAADYFFTSTGEGNAVRAQFTLTFSGLTAGDTFSLDLWASRVAANENPSGLYSYSLDGGANWIGFNVLNKDGSAAGGDWESANTATSPFIATTHGNNQALYMNVSDVLLTGDTLLVRGIDSDISDGQAQASFASIAAARLTVIPEPSTGLLAFGALGLAIARRRR